MSTPNFRFKQFTVWHDKCAMKVGTDGVLLGAWAGKPLETLPRQLTDNYETILDVGTGSGLIALMLAQRFPNAKIDAIDIDRSAVEQANENGANAFLSSLQDWQIVNRPSSNRQLYDLIVSNPPYFQNSLKNPDAGRKTARHTDSLSYEELIVHSARLLADNGQLALILPAEAEKEIIALAEQQCLTLTRLTRVYSKVSKPARRVLMAFEKLSIINHQLSIIEDSLVLEDEKGGRSAAYSKLCQEFYL